MPMYEYKCSVCGRKRDVFLKLADLDSTVYCQRDGFAMNRQICAPFISPDYAGYESPVVPGKWIEGRKAHEEHLRETGCRVFEPGEHEAIARRRKEEDEKFDKALDATAEELISKLPTEKRDRLAAEMEAGVTATVERGAPNIN